MAKPPVSKKSSERFDTVIDMPFGPFGIRTGGLERRRVIVETAYLPPGTELIPAQNALAAQAATALRDYLDDPRKLPDLPLSAEGTVFQQRVWRQIQALHAGCTASYGALARLLATAPRAVGNACRRNPIPLFIPCHRVVGKSGLGGFAGDVSGRLIQVKSWLLHHEHAIRREA